MIRQLRTWRRRMQRRARAKQLILEQQRRFSELVDAFARSTPMTRKRYMDAIQRRHVNIARLRRIYDGEWPWKPLLDDLDV